MNKISEQQYLQYDWCYTEPEVLFYKICKFLIEKGYHNVTRVKKNCEELIIAQSDYGSCDSIDNLSMGGNDLGSMINDPYTTLAEI